MTATETPSTFLTLMTSLSTSWVLTVNLAVVNMVFLSQVFLAKPQESYLEELRLGYHQTK